jgi:hypothetical protein
MYIEPLYLKGFESGPVAILGNGPSLNNWDLTKLDCPTIGINLSSDRIESEYWVTVARDRADDVATGKITAKKAVITQRVAHITDACPQLVVPVCMPLPDNYGAYSEYGFNIFRYDLTKPLHKTFGGMLAVQAALFLGYTTLYLIGMDGGTYHFYPHQRDNIPPNYHRNCFWHVYDWWRGQTAVRIYQTNPSAVIDWFPVKSPPMRR